MHRCVDGEHRDLLGFEDVLRHRKQRLHGRDRRLQPFLEECRHGRSEPLRLADLEDLLRAVQAERHETLRRLGLLGSERTLDAEVSWRRYVCLSFSLFVHGHLVAAAEELPDHLLALLVGDLDALQARDALLPEVLEDLALLVDGSRVLDLVDQPLVTGNVRFEFEVLIAELRQFFELARQELPLGHNVGPFLPEFV